MLYDDEFYIRVKNRAEPWLFQIPGVIAVGLGPKLTAGEFIGEPAIQVYVTDKKPLHTLALQEVIPHEIEGIKTDVIQGGVWANTAATSRTIRNCPSGQITEVTKTNPMLITSVAHGLAPGDQITIAGINSIEPAALIIGEAATNKADTFTLPTIDGTDHPTDKGGGIWFKVCTLHQPCCGPGGNITDASNTNPVVITTDSTHGLQSGDQVKIEAIAFMTQIKGKEFTVGKVTPTTFELKVDGSFFTMGTNESGKWAKICMARTGGITKATNGKPVIITSPNHGLSPGDQVHIFAVRGMQATVANIPGINSFRNDNPFRVGQVTTDTFELKIEVEEDSLEAVDVAKYAPYDSGGVWVRIREDGRRYSRMRGGIRIAMHKEAVTKKVSVYKQPPGVHKIFEKHQAPEELVPARLTYGTLGCLAIDNATGKKVLVSNYHVLYATDEGNVHHPDYKKCKSHKIGERTRHADPGTMQTPGLVDAAIAILKHQDKADPEIVDIGPVKDAKEIKLQEISDADHRNLGYRVRKRGITTLLTEGLVTAINLTYSISDPTMFLRDQIGIQPIAGVGHGVFSAPGDSGSAIVNDNNEIVGMLEGVDADGFAFASPIKAVENLLNIKIWSEKTAGGQVATDASDPLRVTAGVPELLAQVSEELSRSETGKEYMALIQRNYQEVESLLHTNKRVAVIWERNGAGMVGELLNFVEVRDVPLPQVIDGKPLVEFVEKILSALKRFGSSKLAADVTRYAPALFQLIGMSYADILETLGAGSSA